MKEIEFNPGDLLVGALGKRILISIVKQGSFKLNSNEVRIYGFVNDENKETFIAYDTDIKMMIVNGSWKLYKVSE